MKLSVKPNMLKYLILGAGAAASALLFLLYATGMDEEGLLQRSHIAMTLLCLLSIAALTALILLTRTITGPEHYPDCFHNPMPGGIGCLAAAAGILITTLGETGETADRVAQLARFMGFAAAVSLTAAGFCRLSSIKPFFLLHVVPCIYFAVRMICQYRYWSSDPQLTDYCFQLLACVALMLMSFHHAAFGADTGRHNRLWFFSLASVYLCCLAIVSPESRLLYLGTGIWAFTDLSCLTAKARRQRPSMNLEEETGTEEG